MALNSKSSRAASRYARAIFDYAGNDQTRLEQTLAELHRFNALMAESEAASAALTTPTFPATQRIALVSDLSAQMGLGEATCRILSVIAQSGRIVILGDILNKTELLRLQASNLVPLSVETSSELSPEQKKHVISRFGVILGKPVEASFAVNLSLIGGFRAVANGRCYDGSVSGWLNNLLEKNVGG